MWMSEKKGRSLTNNVCTKCRCWPACDLSYYNALRDVSTVNRTGKQHVRHFDGSTGRGKCSELSYQHPLFAQKLRSPSFNYTLLSQEKVYMQAMQNIFRQLPPRVPDPIAFILTLICIHYYWPSYRTRNFKNMSLFRLGFTMPRSLKSYWIAPAVTIAKPYFYTISWLSGTLFPHFLQAIQENVFQAASQMTKLLWTLRALLVVAFVLLSNSTILRSIDYHSGTADVWFLHQRTCYSFIGFSVFLLLFFFTFLYSPKDGNFRLILLKRGNLQNQKKFITKTTQRLDNALGSVDYGVNARHRVSIHDDEENLNTTKLEVTIRHKVCVSRKERPWAINVILGAHGLWFSANTLWDSILHRLKHIRSRQLCI